MKYAQITQTDQIEESIKILSATVPDCKVEDYRNQYEITDKREIMDVTKRPNKTIKVDETTTRLEYVNRLALPLQKRIVNSTVSFTFGNPVELVCEADEETTEGQILTAVKRMLSDNKIDSFNRGIARDLARCTEVAECWFPVPTEESHDHYGFTTSFKIRVQQFSPWNGDMLYPFFDKTGDMIAFSRAFAQKEDGKDVRYFEVYTDEEKVIWKNAGQGWEEESKEPNVLKKIPVVYAKQDRVEWHDVETMINRLEKVLSNFGDTNDYFGSPILGIWGKIMGLSAKGTQGKVMEFEGDAKAEYISWDQAPESVKFEVENLFRLIYGLSQTPDLSFDSVKGLDISGIAMRFLFMDAHLKVQDKREILDAYLQRRINILKAFVGVLNTTWRKQSLKLEIAPKIVPFIITNEKDIIDLLSEATGGKPVISQKTAVGMTGLVDDVEEEYKQIQQEQEQANKLDVFNPVA
ncbi:phage portal protein [Spirosoma sp. HMF4905]|uniref:Phage portal protein n=1 Tax=Spirosoma arboris TaxID=2682092 RepID=A0A7K1SIH3_9BACT|nr:phage portal protein [Spirosoma arboris]MVM33610.1 phage portal protein [Spirosoma arboris]